MALGDGVHRFGGADGIAIIKNGDTVRIYDYATKNITRPMTVQEATAALQKARRASSPEIKAEKVEATAKSSTEKVLQKTKTPPKKEGGATESAGKRHAIKYPTYSETDIRENMEVLADMDPVATVDASKLERSGKTPKEMFAEYFSSLGNSIYSEEFGDIALGNSSVKSEIRHGLTAEKIASMEAIPSVIEQGKVIFFESKMDGDDRVKRIVVAAPIKIGDASYYMGVMLQRDPATQYLYLHNVAIEKEMTAEARAHLVTTGADAQSNHLSMTSILQKAVDVKLQKQKISSKQKSGTQNLSAEDIAAFAKENVPGYENMLPAERREIRAMIRQGKALGVPDADIKTYARVSARSGVRVVFSKDRNAVTYKDGTKGFGDGYYDPDTNEIVVNPEGKRSTTKLLVHELSHALYSYKKYRTVLDREVKNMDEKRANDVAILYRNAGESAEVISEELAVHHAEDVLGHKNTLERVLMEEPNIKSKILSFFRVAKSAYHGDERLSRAAGRLYERFEKAFNDFAARNKANLAAETTPIAMRDSDGRRKAIDFLQEDDLPNYLRAGNRKNKYKQEAIKKGEKIILTTHEEIYEYIERAIKGDKTLLPVAYGKVADRLYEETSNYSEGSIQIKNYYLELVAYDIHHAYTEHLKAKEDGDIDLTLDDFKNIPDYLATYDDLVYAIEFASGNKRICVSKKIDGGRVLLIETVSKSHGSIEFKNLIGVSEKKYLKEYENKYKKGNGTNTGGSKNSNISPHDATTSTIVIPDSAKKINPSDEISSRRKALPDTTEAVGKTKKQYEPSKKEIFFTAKDRAYIEAVEKSQKIYLTSFLACVTIRVVIHFGKAKRSWKRIVQRRFKLSRAFLCCLCLPWRGCSFFGFGCMGTIPVLCVS